MKFIVFALAPLLLAAPVPAVAQIGALTGTPEPGVTSPRLIHEVKPHYPTSAVSSGLSGTVVLRCVVQPDGSVGDIQVATSLAPVLDEEAVRALQQWRFAPATKNGSPVPVSVDVEIVFRTEIKGPRLDSADVFKAGPGVTLPRLVSEVKPGYPDDARAAGIRGTVVLDCVVLPDGTVGDLRVSTGIDSALDGQAVTALKQWRFKPGLRDGRPVPVQVSVEISFEVR